MFADKTSDQQQQQGGESTTAAASTPSSAVVRSAGSGQIALRFESPASELLHARTFQGLNPNVSEEDESDTEIRPGIVGIARGYAHFQNQKWLVCVSIT